jgi:hypothetical protein
MSNLSLSDLIFLAKQSDNVIIANWLKDLEKLINKTPNDGELGGKIRRL